MTTKVLMTADTVGGVWTYALELADALEPYDVEVHLATMGRRLTSEQGVAAKKSAVADLYESDFALEWHRDPWHDVDRAGEWLLQLEATVRPDVVHLNGYAHGALPWRAPVVMVGHSDVLSWWEAVRAVPAPPEWNTYRDRVSAGLAAADAIVAPTADVLDALTRIYGCRGGTVIGNCRRDDWVGYVGKAPVVIGAGRLWDEAKNLGMLQQVSSALPWRVLIAGDPTHPGSGERLCESRGGTARLLGEVAFEDLARRLLRASIFVLPAKYEPFGLGVLEAAQAGCALVLSDIPSLREIWGDVATYVDPDRPDALTSALLHLIDNPLELQAMGRAARARAKFFRPERTAAGYVDVYRGLLESGQLP